MEKVSVFRVFLVHIFPHSNWIRPRKIQNKETFYAVTVSRMNWKNVETLRIFRSTHPLVFRKSSCSKGIFQHKTHNEVFFKYIYRVSQEFFEKLHRTVVLKRLFAEKMNSTAVVFSGIYHNSKIFLQFTIKILNYRALSGNFLKFSKPFENPLSFSVALEHVDCKSATRVNSSSIHSFLLWCA